MSDHDTTHEPTLDPTDVTPKQLETIHEIHNSPTATQAELAETLGVTSATISQRVNSIEGFDWSNRRALVDPLFEAGGPLADDDGNGASVGDGRTVSDTRSVDSESTDDTAVTDTESSDDTESPDDTEHLTPYRRAIAHQEPETNPSEDTANGDTEPSTRSALESGVATDGHGDGNRPTDEPKNGTEPGRTHSSATTRDSHDDQTSDSPTATDDSLEMLTEQVESLTGQVETLTDQVGSLSEHVDPLEGEPTGNSSLQLDDSEFVHKVLHACLNAENISEDEELALLKEVTE